MHILMLVWFLMRQSSAAPDVSFVERERVGNVPLAQVKSPEKPPSDCELSWVGRYQNLWGFEVTIPPGRKGYPNSPVSGCGAEMVILGTHGIVIPLSREPYEKDRHIEIYAGYNSLELRNTREAVDRQLASVRERAAAETVRVLQSRAVSLAGINGSRATVRYEDRKSRQQMVEDALLFLRSIDGTQTVPSYTLSIHLLTPASSYPVDRLVLESLLETVRLTVPKQ